VAGKAGTRPYVAPGIAGNEVLKIPVEVSGRGYSSVHIFIAEDSSPDFHALLVALSVIHECHPLVSSIWRRALALKIVHRLIG
jgi:hypothetical protein